MFSLKPYKNMRGREVKICKYARADCKKSCAGSVLTQGSGEGDIALKLAAAGQHITLCDFLIGQRHAAGGLVITGKYPGFTTAADACTAGCGDRQAVLFHLRH